MSQYFPLVPLIFVTSIFQYNLPKPKGGQHAVMPLLTADQRFPHQWAKKMKKVDALDPNYIARKYITCSPCFISTYLLRKKTAHVVLLNSAFSFVDLIMWCIFSLLNGVSTISLQLKGSQFCNDYSHLSNFNLLNLVSNIFFLSVSSPFSARDITSRAVHHGYRTIDERGINGQLKHAKIWKPKRRKPTKK